MELKLLSTKKIALLLFCSFSIHIVSASTEDNYFQLSVGKAFTNAKSAQLFFPGTLGSGSSDYSFGFAAGHQFYKDSWIEFAYENLGEIEVATNFSYQKTSVLSLQAHYDLLNLSQFGFSVHGGIARWKSTLKQPVNTLFSTSVSGSGYTPTAGAALKYQLTNDFDIGLRWDYYHRIGDDPKLFDQRLLNIGDLVGAVTNQGPADIRANVVKFYIRGYF